MKITKRQLKQLVKEVIEESNYSEKVDEDIANKSEEFMNLFKALRVAKESGKLTDEEWDIIAFIVDENR